MAKFEVEMELTGLKLKIKGEREDIPQISRNLGEQIAGLFQPAANIVQGQLPTKHVEATIQPPENGDGQTFRTADGHAELAIYGSYNTEDERPEAYVAHNVNLSDGAFAAPGAERCLESFA